MTPLPLGLLLALDRLGVIDRTPPLKMPQPPTPRPVLPGIGPDGEPEF